jgi:hypothetical protein
MSSSTPRLLAAALAALGLAAAAAPAGAAAKETVTTIQGAPASGPSRYDRVFVTKFGPASARRVLVLAPGTSGGAGDFTLTARELVKRVPGLAVWAVDRRTQAFEDTSVFRAALTGTRTPQQAFDYYLGWLTHPEQTDRFRPLDESTVGFTREWGLAVALGDLRRVVRSASAGGRRSVLLGGHSLGASLAVAYAAWDFGGRPGHRDLDGLVLMDGGLLGSFSTPSLARSRERIRDLAKESPFLDLVGLGLPWAAGVFAEVGALAALKEPTAPSIAQAFPLLPEAFKPPVPATNRGLLGYAFDESTSPDKLALIHVRAGRLATTGSPRDWDDGAVTPLRRLVETFAQEPANAIEWYFPKRLGIDVDAAQGLVRSKALDELGLRVHHRRSIDLPVYAIQSSLTGGRVLRGARRLIATSEVPARRSVLVDASATDSHLDSLTAAPAESRFLKTVVPFLERLSR